MVDPVEFFDTQFRRQVKEGEFALNPFERAALDFMEGSVLDLGCGLGNLALEAGRRGGHVVAVDASATATERIRQVAAAEALAVKAVLADVAGYRVDGRFDTIVAIGLLMFFRREQALALLEEIKAHVNPGGRAIVNVLIDGTTFMGMFHESNYYLFGRDELEEHFAGWHILLSRHDSFEAPGGMHKVFSTVIAEKTGTMD